MILNPKDQIIADKIENFVKKYKVKYLSESKVINQKLFQIESDFVENNPDKVKLFQGQALDAEKEIKLLTNDKAGKTGRATWFIIDKEVIKVNKDIVNKWKVVVSSANAGGQKRDNKLEILDDSSAFGRSRLALKAFDRLEEAKNFYAYVDSNIIRFAFLLTDESITSLAKLVPNIIDYTNENSIINFNKDIDNQLVELLGISKEEYIYIRSKINEKR